MRACGLQAGKPRTQQHRAQRVQATTDAGLAASTHTWKWKNHNINYVVRSPRESCVCAVRTWRAEAAMATGAQSGSTRNVRAA